MTVNVRSVKRDEMAVKKKRERLHTVLLFFPTPYSSDRECRYSIGRLVVKLESSRRVLDLPWAHACLGIAEEVDHGLFPLQCAQ
jgi:hypothetical protein